MVDRANNGGAAARGGARSGERCPSVARGGFTDVGTTRRSFYLSSKPRGREKERKMRAISLAEANKIMNGTFASAKRRKAHALAAMVLDASHLPWEGPTLTPALAGADFP